MADYTHFADFSIRQNGVDIHVDLSKYNDRFKQAQWELDNMIMTSMIPYMSIQTGTLINTTRAQSASLAGSGVVIAASKPYGRYQYFGKKMVDSQTGKGPRLIPNVGYRYRKGATLVPTSQPLTYSNPEATPEWFETAKKNHLQEWIKKVEEVIGGK